MPSRQATAIRRAIRRQGMAKKIQRFFRNRRKYRRYKKIPIGMPAKKLVKLKYVDEVQLNPLTSGIQAYYFSANGMYDPNITGVGRQPRYFDETMIGYDHYQVIGSKIKVTQVPFHNAESAVSSDRPCVWGVTLQDTATLQNIDALSMIESNRNKGQWRMGSSILTGLHTKGRTPVVYRGFSAKKFLGDLSDKHEGSKTSNPSDQAFFGVWAGAPLSGVDPGTVAFIVEIVYTAILKEPTYVPRS